jgi:hypothetical protein
VKVSPPSNALAVPLSAAMLNDVAIVAVVAAVTKPLALIVNTGIVVVLPTEPTSVLTVAKVAAPVTLPEPSNDASSC